jgi:trk/ktr system potassium uptake protein
LSSPSASAPSAQQIPFAAALYVLSALITVVAGGMLLPALAALSRHEPEIAAAFAGSALGGAFLGGGVMLALQGPQRPALMRENIGLIIVAWIVLALFGAIPLLASGTGMSIVGAVFESTAALTTTGASLLDAPEIQSPAILLWLAELQWFGGYASIAMGATVLSALGTAGLDVQRTLLPLGQSGPAFERFFHIAASLGLVYLTATLLGFFVIWIGGVPRFDAFCLALSGIATGGLKLRSEGFSAYHAPLSEAALVFLMLFGAMNFMTHWAAFRGGTLRGMLRAYGREPELWLLLTACALATLLLTSAGAMHQMTGLSFTVFNAVSLVTTSGFWDGPVTQPSPAIALGAILLVFIGGASVSTSSGLKLMRLWLLLRHARRELRRLVHPRSAMAIRFRGRGLDEEVLRGMWAFFAGYVAIFAVVSLALAALGLALVPAMSAAVSALANTGPLLTIVSGGGEPYALLPDSAKWLLSVVMIIGRLEVLAFLSLLHPAFWRS